MPVCVSECRLIDNMAARNLWHTYCGSQSSVETSFFVASVKKYLSEGLYMSETDIQCYMGEAQCKALIDAVDVDGDGRVSPVTCAYMPTL